MKNSLFISEKENLHRYKLFAAMLAVFILALFIRLLYMTSLEQIILFPDSLEYLGAVDKVSALRLDTSRVPVYPLFIKLACCLFPAYSGKLAVVILQVIISAVCVSLIFYTAISFFKGYLKAFAASLFCISNIWLINWDFLVLTESLTVFFMVLLLVFFSLYIKNNSYGFMLTTYLLCCILIFLKPFYLLLPAGIFILMILRSIKEGTLKRALISGILSLTVIYVLAASYCWLNFVQNGYKGISDVSAVNQMGKVLQYRMYELGDNDKIKSYIRQEAEIRGEEILEPVEFICKYDLKKNGYKEVSEFAGKIIRRNPHIFVVNTLKLVFGESGLYKQNAFTDYNSNNYIEKLPFVFIDYSQIVPFIDTFGYVFCLMVFELFYLIYRVSARKEYEWNWILVFFLTAYQLVMSVMGAHAEYQRLMAPVYVMIFFMMFKYIFKICDLIRAYFVRLTR